MLFTLSQDTVLTWSNPGFLGKEDQINPLILIQYVSSLLWMDFKSLSNWSTKILGKALTPNCWFLFHVLTEFTNLLKSTPGLLRSSLTTGLTDIYHEKAMSFSLFLAQEFQLTWDLIWVKSQSTFCLISYNSTFHVLVLIFHHCTQVSFITSPAEVAGKKKNNSVIKLALFSFLSEKSNSLYFIASFSYCTHPYNTATKTSLL